MPAPLALIASALPSSASVTQQLRDNDISHPSSFRPKHSLDFLQPLKLAKSSKTYLENSGYRFYFYPPFRFQRDYASVLTLPRLRESGKIAAFRYIQQRFSER